MAERKRTLKRTSLQGNEKLSAEERRVEGIPATFIVFLNCYIGGILHGGTSFSDEKETMVSVNTAIHHLLARSLLKEIEKEQSAAEWKR